jgi:apolipoprotein N-acyltransferase
VPSRLHAWLLAVASGLLLALSFPKFGHPAVAWFALTPLLVALDRAPLRAAFWIGLLTGFVYFGGTIYWTANVMGIYGGLPMVVASAITALLVAYMALFPACFALICARSVRTFGTVGLASAPFVWVATELGRTHIFGGFPWVLLGYSQVTVLPVAQTASLVGVYGISWLVAGVGTAAAMLLATFARTRPEVARRFGAPRRRPGSWTMTAGLCACLSLPTIGLAIWGQRRAAASEWTRAGEPVTIGLVQGNVDQAQKWDAASASSIFESYLRLTRETIEKGAQAVVWPESSTPFFFEEDRGAANRIRDIARAANVPILVGSDQIEAPRAVDSTRQGTAAETGGPPAPPAPRRYYNAAFLVQGDGSTGAVYRKMHLVPFGEYVPLKSLLFFVGPLVEAVSDFSAGDAAVLLPMRGHVVSTAICYEIVYPDLVRQSVRGGSELLTTITNDAWFGDTSAPYQHFAQASMRAIEQGRYLVRAANTGISGVVDPYGRVLTKTGVFVPAAVVGQARFLKTETVYSRTGDAFAYASTIAALACVVAARRRVLQ